MMVTKRCSTFIESSPSNRKYNAGEQFSEFGYPMSVPKQFLLEDKRMAIFLSTLEEQTKTTPCQVPFIEMPEPVNPGQLPKPSRTFWDTRFFFTEDGAVAFAYKPIHEIFLRDGTKAEFRNET
jgi:hypothetical protein